MARDASRPAGRAWDTVTMVGTRRGPVEVARAGEGPGVLVVHGIPGSWRQCFTLAEDLAHAFHVVAPSRPGYGRTPVSGGRTYDEQADLYAAVLDALGIERVVVVAASGGGPSGIAFAERHRARAAGLVLACAMVPHLIEVPGALRLLAAPGLGDLVSLLTRTVARRRIASERAVARALARDLTPDEQRRVVEDPAIRADLIAFARTHQEAPAGLPGMRADLAQVRAAQAAGERTLRVASPTLVLHGTADEICPPTHAEYHARAIDGAALETYQDAGHAFFVTRRREASARIETFAGEALR